MRSARPSIVAIPDSPACRASVDEAPVALHAERGADALRRVAVDDDAAGAARRRRAARSSSSSLAIVRRKLSIVTSKWTIERLTPSLLGVGVAFAITHSLVSGETYGAAW